MKYKTLISEEEFLLEKLKNDFNLDLLLDNYILSDNIIMKYYDKLNIKKLIQSQTLSNYLIDFLLFEKNLNCNDYFNLIKYQCLNINQIYFILNHKYKNSFNNEILQAIFNNQTINDDILLKYSHEIVLFMNETSLIFNNFSINAIMTFFKKTQFNNIHAFLKHYKFTEDELEIILTEIYTPRIFKLICKYQTISENFIVKHNDLIDSNLLIIICKYQSLSHDFIKKNISCFNSTCRLLLQSKHHYTINQNQIYAPHDLIL